MNGSEPPSASSTASAADADDAAVLGDELIGTLQAILAPATTDDPEAVLAELGVVTTAGDDGVAEALAMLGHTTQNGPGELASGLLVNANKLNAAAQGHGLPESILANTPHAPTDQAALAGSGDNTDGDILRPSVASQR